MSRFRAAALVVGVAVMAVALFFLSAGSTGVFVYQGF
jgi:hypothetical protein